MMWKRIASGGLVLAALVGGLAACGDDGDSASAVDVTVKASGGDGKFSFDIPKEIDGGLVNLTLDNTDSVPHEIALVKVKEGTDPQDLADQWLSQDGAPIPDFVESSVAGVGNAAPKEQATSTQKIEPGEYVYFCTFGDGEAAHYKNGMLGSVTVKGDEGKGDLPETDNTITAEDYTFSNVHLKAGDGAVKVDFKNIGSQQLHHAQLLPVKAGATEEQVLQDLSSPNEPQFIDVEHGTGTMVLAPGQEQVTDLTLKKGQYVMLCFLSDTQGGPPHFLPAEAGGHGMSKLITVE